MEQTKEADSLANVRGAQRGSLCWTVNSYSIDELRACSLPSQLARLMPSTPAVAVALHAVASFVAEALPAGFGSGQRDRNPALTVHAAT